MMTTMMITPPFDGVHVMNDVHGRRSYLDSSSLTDSIICYLFGMWMESEHISSFTFHICFYRLLLSLVFGLNSEYYPGTFQIKKLTAHCSLLTDQTHTRMY